MIRTASLLLLGLAAPVWSQVSRESYRAPYQRWRQAAPALEQDASSPTAAFPEQVRASPDAAQAFFAARAGYLTAAQPDAAEQTAWASKPLLTAESMLTTPQNVDQLLAVTAAKAGTNIAAFPADDKDVAIRRVRQALERERAALKVLTDALSARKVPLTELIDRSDEAEIQRAAVFQTLNSSNARRTQLAEHVKREATDWTVYYKNLLVGSSSANRTPTTGAAAVPGAPTPAPSKLSRPATTGQVQLSRYTGEWVFPSKGLFYGPQPESVELLVQESNGRMSGTLSAKFAMPAHTVKFDFQGALQQAKSQTFPLQTSDGATGNVEFIPGSAINLLEVNFQAAGTAGNFILVKK